MQSHGEITIAWAEQLLVMYAYGPFNDEGAIDAIDSLKQSILIKNLESWCKLEIWDQDSFGSPFVMNHAKEYYLWCEERGCRATAVVVSTSLQRNILELDFLTNVKVFNSENKARAWLVEN